MSRFSNFMSVELLEATSIDEVIALINNSEAAEAEEVAGQYAFSAAEDNGYGLRKDNIEAALDYLIDNEAKFDYIKALEKAKYCIEQYLELSKEFFGEDSEEYKDILKLI